MYTPVAIHHRSFRYNNIRLKQIKSNMNADFKWTTLHAAVSTIITTGGHGHKVNQSIFSTFSATCYYYGESLSEELGADAPPLGLVHTAFGGSMIEQWLKEDTVKSCKNASNYTAVGGGEWWQARVLPFSQMTLKGWLWYQGMVKNRIPNLNPALCGTHTHTHTHTHTACVILHASKVLGPKRCT